MCGIAGYYDPALMDGEVILREINIGMKHRGPDANGVFIDGDTGLCHTRLSIIDLSENAAQPMHSWCGRYVIVYNGEVYNFREIQKEIPGNYHSTSDTEVVLQAFVKWGPSCVKRFNGMFAFVIFDKEERKLHIFRDRMGIKPLYYFHEGAVFYFSSELKSLLAFPGIKKQLNTDKRALNAFLHLGYIPEPFSIYDKIKKFPSASYGEFDLNGFSVNSWWNIYEKSVPGYQGDLRESKERLKELLTDSVRLRLVSDVPYGTFLSGGTDSSLISAIAARLVPGKLKTFTIGFDNIKHDESPYASAVARHLNSEHHEYRLKPGEAARVIFRGLDNFDEPFADSSYIPTLLVSQLAKQEVSMVLTGDGGDELFHGYGAYRWAERLNKPLWPVLLKLFLPLLPYYGHKGKRLAAMLSFPGPEHRMSHIFSQEQYLFALGELKSLVAGNVASSFDLPGETAINSMNLSPVEKQAMFDLVYYLRDDLLVKVDRASMLASLECRLPLLDYRVVEYALSLPESMKYAGGKMKLLLKQLLADYLPASLFDRPKWGFSIPLQQWLRQDLNYLLEDYLGKDRITSANLFNFDYVDKLKRDFTDKGRGYLYNRLWLLIVAQRWYFNQDK